MFEDWQHKYSKISLFFDQAWLDISLVLFFVFMDPNVVLVNKNAKRTRRLKSSSLVFRFDQ